MMPAVDEPLVSRPLWAAWLAPLPLPLLRALGRMLGWLLWCFAHRRRRVVNTNLQLCFPHLTTPARRQLACATFVKFAQSLLDRAWLWHAPVAVVQARLVVKGELDWLASDGAKVLFAPHFVGLDAGWTALTLNVDRLFATIYAKQTRPRLDVWVLAGRSRFGNPQLLPRQQLGRSVLQVMRRDTALYVLPDMDLGSRDAVFVPFFGVEAATVTTLPRLADIGQCAVAPVTTRLTSTGYEVTVHAPWSNYPSGDPEADVAAMNARLEAFIATMPDQYYWVHKRFKTRPPGEKSIY